jgi:hypothetical protein
MTKTVLKGPWSYSRASSCSLALYKEKVLKLPPEPRPERLLEIDRTRLGTLLHTGADLQLRAISGLGLPSQALAAEAKASGRLSSLSVSQEVMKDAGDMISAVDIVDERMATFYRRFRMTPEITIEERDAFIRDRMIGNELRLAIDGGGNIVPFDTCPEDGWRGVVDYAEDSGDGLLTIIDFKNRPAMFSDSELAVDEQLCGYLTLAMHKYPQFTRFRAGIYYFQYGVTDLVDFSREQIALAWSRLQMRARFKSMLTEDKIQPEPGFGKCQYCHYLASCSAGNKVLEPSMTTPTDMVSAREAAAWLIVNQERVAGVKKALRAFTQEHGVVLLDEETGVGFNAHEMTRYDKNKTLSIIKGLIDTGVVEGHKLSEFTSLNLAEVKKLAKHEDVNKALEPARSQEIETEFDVFKPRKRTAVKPGPKPVKPEKPQRQVAGRVRTASDRSKS